VLGGSRSGPYRMCWRPDGVQRSAPLSSMGPSDMVPCLEQSVTALKCGVNNVRKVHTSSYKRPWREISSLSGKCLAHTIEASTDHPKRITISPKSINFWAHFHVPNFPLPGDRLRSSRTGTCCKGWLFTSRHGTKALFRRIRHCREVQSGKWEMGK
jgi:hypothetical protein